ncbi:membrane protein [Candidatus Rhodobacter oscarellae]|uniref:Membrane protein n=1 Tax=Candidatus Rhodobacter oscarellae TaxID=1675527 RepID=A0A0J9EDE3_9RHOB|nr:DMT family transporter [Candidatus Rhodobacter lobularis]KMW59744.1 membrane protein [Candidatus Rhodobacter lobularis]
MTTRPLLAAGCVVAAMALIGLVDNLVGMIAARAGLWQFHFLRAAMALAFLAVAAPLLGLSLRPRRVWAAALRGSFIAISMLFYFGALSFMSVAEASAGMFTAPIFVMAITVLVLRQRVPMLNVAAGLIAFCGALLVLQPDVTGGTLARLMPLGGAFFYACGAVVTRRLCAQEGTLALLTAFFTALLIIGAVGAAGLAMSATAAADGADGFMLRAWGPMTPTLWWLIAAQAVGSVIGVGLLTRAYLLAEAPYVAVFEYVLLIFASAWTWVLWGQALNGTAWLGIGLIFGSGLLLARAERRSRPHIGT